MDPPVKLRPTPPAFELNRNTTVKKMNETLYHFVISDLTRIRFGIVLACIAKFIRSTLPLGSQI